MKRRHGLEHVDRQVGAVIRRFRLARGMSQEKLASALDVSFQQIQKYENGSNAVATTRLPALCKALGISPNDLYDWKK
jgi:transcriptional regulator with XRE-family HTH domain